jgi:two-component system sensor histidine kinase KdpD
VPLLSHKKQPWQYVGVLIVVVLTTVGVFLLREQLGDANISLVYLLIVLFCAVTTEPGVSIFCSGVSFLCYDFVLIPPILSFVPDSPIKLLDPVSFFVVALVTSILAERSRVITSEKVSYQQASQFRSTILQLISHNLRTPLAAIKTGLTGVLASQALSPEATELLHAANQECDRLNRLIGNVLQISRLDSHTVQLKEDWNGLDDVISSVFARWKSLVSSGQLTASIPPTLPLIKFDFALIENVLINLVENAVRHGRLPIHVCVELHRSEVRVIVIDKGNGVPVEQREQLFKHFASVKSGGLGLGLAVCKGLLDAHRGSIWATFHPNETRFIFALPLIIFEGTDNE